MWMSFSISFEFTLVGRWLVNCVYWAATILFKDLLDILRYLTQWVMVIATYFYSADSEYHWPDISTFQITTQ